MNEAEAIIENANKHAEQTRIVTALEAAQIIQQALADADAIKRQNTLILPGDISKK